MDKTVVFIGGTSYSGSTLLDMILANDEKGFSLGEIKSFLYPTQKHHINPLCGCGDDTCDFKDVFKQRDIPNIYLTIFKKYPHVNYIVDSSKSPYWIYSQSKKLEKSGIQVKHVLIWKTPIEIAESFHKRGRGDKWIDKWVNYHKRYFSLIKKFQTIKYHDLVKNSDSLQALCSYLGIKYNKSKYNYWEKKHHTFFGNKSTKIHLYKENKNRNEIISKIQRVHNVKNDQYDNLGEIYYKNNSGEDLKNKVKQVVEINKQVKTIYRCLNQGTREPACKLNKLNQIVYLFLSRFIFIYSILYKRFIKR